MAKESVFKGAVGLVNTVEPHRLRYLENGFCQLAEAVNVIIDDNGSVKRRFGRSSVFNAATHSLWSKGKYCFFVSGGDLYRRMLDKTNVLVMGGVGDYPAFFEYFQNKCYMSNGVVRLIIDDSSVTNWTANVPSQMKGDSRVLGMPFQFTRMCAHAGRMFVLGDRLYQSEPGNARCFDLAAGSIPFEDAGEFASVGEGMYISHAGGVSFLQGSSKDDFESRMAYTKPIIPGTLTAIDASAIDTGIEYYGKLMIWVSSDGVCIGDSRGVVHNKTVRSLVFDKAISGAAAVMPGYYFFSLEVE
jgi:hypothetical protein